MYEELKFWYLRNHKLFSSLNSKEIKQLSIIGNFKRASKNEIIHFSDNCASRVFFLKKGAIKIIEVSEDGDEELKDIIQKGDLFGEFENEQDHLNKEVAKVATREVIICSFLLSDFEQILLKNPQLALNFSKLVGFKLKRYKVNYNNLISKNVKQRFKLFLIDWLERDSVIQENAYYIENYLTQNDIAQLICSSRQTATSLINSTQNAGIIEYNRKEIIVRDIEKLRNF
jgi:CRP-like cAMP-binding protein